MREFDIGASIPRVEDARLLVGHGRYVDDINLPNLAHLKVLRSPNSAARIISIDVTAARAAPGVLKVLTGADAAADGLGAFISFISMPRADGSPNFVPPYRLLAIDFVRMVGDAVAVAIAETCEQAQHAIELIDVQYDPLPVVTETARACEAGQPAVWPEVSDNVCFVYRTGDAEATAAAFAKAARVVEQRFDISRVMANPMETRSAIGHYDVGAKRFTLYAGVQAPHLIRDELAGSIFKLPPGDFRVIAPDTGGAFGAKTPAYPELGLVLWAAKRTGRPVKWVGERSEGFLSDHHARDNSSRVSLALDGDGKFLGLRVRTMANIGAYIDSFGVFVPTQNLGGLAGPYVIGSFDVEVTGVFTNTHPTSAYRGAGRPEASYCLERIIDIAAREMAIDAVALRRRNMIRPDQMPYDTGYLFKYDTGAFEQTMDMALTLCDWAGVSARRDAARGRGKLFGAGIAYAIEMAGGPQGSPFEEGAEIRFDSAGNATCLFGTHSQGQGHVTAFRQLASHILGLEPERVRVVFGDTDQIYHGKGTFGSRSVGVGGAAFLRASEKLVEKGKAIAGHALEAAIDDIHFADGRFTVAGTDRSLGIHEVAKSAFDAGRLPRGMEMGFAASAIVQPPGPTFPNGCHICEVEIDPETGSLEIVRYGVVDDVGRVVNPLLLDGQIHGGIAQGVGQALFERIVYDPDSGQLISASFMDYCMPRADDLPSFLVEANEAAPSRNNPLGIKGAGEAGTVGALPVVMNAVNDALAPLGIRHFEMPATPERIWRAIQAAASA